MSETFLNRYRLDRFLGQGAMGRVYLAADADNPGLPVVVKALHPHIAKQDRFWETFERERHTLGRLNHPYIVRLLDAGIDAKHGPCLVMDYIAGISLEQLLTKTPRLDPVRLGRLVAGICHAIDHAHEQGIIHRDLKPANIMVCEPGRKTESVCVMDFGLAHLTTHPHISMHRLKDTGIIAAKGTPAYICPEQLRGDSVEPRSDLYSLGVLMFEALTGSLPFAETDVPRLLQCHLRNHPLSFDLVGVRDVSKDVEHIVRTLLSKYPPERPRNGRHLIELYERAIGVFDLWENATPRVDPRPPFAPSYAAVRDVDAYDGANPAAFRREMEAWMPESIAALKVRGFVHDTGGEVVASEPGLLRLRLPGPETGGWFGFGRKRSKGFDIALRLVKPNHRENRLQIGVEFRPVGSQTGYLDRTWLECCNHLFEELKSYMLAS